VVHGTVKFEKKNLEKKRKIGSGNKMDGKI
jgi:hypothetical protein